MHKEYKIHFKIFVLLYCIGTVDTLHITINLSQYGSFYLIQSL